MFLSAACFINYIEQDEKIYSPSLPCFHLVFSLHKSSSWLLSFHFQVRARALRPMKCKHINKWASSHLLVLHITDCKRKKVVTTGVKVSKEILLSCLTLSVCLFKSKFFQLFDNIREERKGGDRKLNLWLEWAWIVSVYFKERQAGWGCTAQLSPSRCYPSRVTLLLTPLPHTDVVIYKMQSLTSGEGCWIPCLNICDFSSA